MCKIKKIVKSTLVLMLIVLFNADIYAAEIVRGGGIVEIWIDDGNNNLWIYKAPEGYGSYTSPTYTAEDIIKICSLKSGPHDRGPSADLYNPEIQFKIADDKNEQNVSFSLSKGLISKVNFDSPYYSDYANNPLYKAQPFLKNGKTFVPMRFFFEQLNYTVDWDAETSCIIATGEVGTIKFQIGNDKVIINGKQMQIELAPELLSDITVIPLRTFTDLLGYRIYFWDDSRNVDYWRILLYSDKGKTIEEAREKARNIAVKYGFSGTSDIQKISSDFYTFECSRKTGINTFEELEIKVNRSTLECIESFSYRTIGLSLSTGN